MGRVLTEPNLEGQREQDTSVGDTSSGRNTRPRPPLRRFLPTLGCPHEYRCGFPICSYSLTTLWVQETPSPPASCLHMHMHTHISTLPPKVAEAELSRSPEENNGGPMVDSKIGQKRDKTWSFSHTEVRSLRFLSQS